MDIGINNYTIYDILSLNSKNDFFKRYKKILLQSQNNFSADVFFQITIIY